MRVRRTRRGNAAPQVGHADGPLAEILFLLRGPVEVLLTRATRRLSRLHPDAFARLGPFQGSTFRIAPTDFPVAFDLSPHPVHGRVSVVRPGAAHCGVARMSAPLADLLALFDGSLDADAAFFSRSIQVEGDIGAAMALHNALESAELRLSDLLALPAGNRLLNGLLDELAKLARKPASPAGA
ncbi:MAG TPA: SCP2 sterol-binding domain-containing protein [Phenylobacterium sp.]|nr:SCP2 sterol-binding domain-containing protein [Phenylobacterium sp.]